MHLHAQAKFAGGKVTAYWLRSLKIRYPIIGRKGLNVMDTTRAAWLTAYNMKRYYFVTYRGYMHAGIVK